MSEGFDIIVVGGGHAGCEAALTAARMGCRALLVTMNLEQLAQMSCNPAIGGLAKGQIVREIDALGGEMAKVADGTGIQFRMLNTGKGPAVQSPRAQSDRAAYRAEMRRRVGKQKNLRLLQATVEELIIENGAVTGVRCLGGVQIPARAVVLTTGTFLRGVIHIGRTTTTGGRMGEPSAEGLSGSLVAHGIRLGRLKTGTPPRLDGKTVRFELLRPQHGDERPKPFSFSTTALPGPQLPCYLTHTNERTHNIIRNNLHRAPLYTGQIQATGPRYCPSIEDKIVRFAGKDAHSVFLEPEGRGTDELYCNGIPTSLPVDVQEEIVHTIAGLEHAHITRYGYAIEYDFAPPTQLRPSLETKAVERLYHAGQINGTSGYEEAAAQGLIAGVNAALQLRGEEPLVLKRDEAYIGVLIDDLVTLGTEEPYRMFTSRAEFRLLLRHDNADRRLMPYGHRLGLVSDRQFDRLQHKEQLIRDTRALLDERRHEGNALAQWLRRPEIAFEDLCRMDAGLSAMKVPADVAEQVQIELKYAGYIQRQLQEVEKMRSMENCRIPTSLDYSAVAAIRNESRQKLSAIRPATLGQASRVSGVTPADISVLMVHLAALSRKALPATPPLTTTSSGGSRST